MPTIWGWCSGRVEGMVKGLWAEFQGRPYLVCGLQVLFIGLIFAFLFRNLYLNWSELSTYQWNLNYLALAGSLFLLLADALLYAHLWRRILLQFGGSLEYRKVFRILLLSQLGRYLPGKVWNLAGVIYLGSKEGVPKSISGASLGLQLLWQILSGLIVFLLTLPLWGHPQPLAGLYPTLLLLPLGAALLHPAFIKRGFGFALRALGEEPRGLNWGYRDTLSQLLLWVLFWVINGIAYYLVINSLTPSPLSQAPMVIGAITIAWVVGFLALFAPAGLGVVEGTLTFLLGFYFPLPVATVVALFTRLLRTIAELISALIAWRL